MYQYKIIRSKRKTVGIQVNDKLEVIVRAPNRFPENKIPQIIQANSKWVEKAIQKQKVRNEQKCELSDEDIIKLKKLAKQEIPAKVEYYSKLMGVKPTAIRITSAKTRFGSCSGKNSLNFSYLLMLYPEEAINYVVVHELAHIIEHNHSKLFYNEIYRIMPNYKIYENLLSEKQVMPNPEIEI